MRRKFKTTDPVYTTKTTRLKGKQIAPAGHIYLSIFFQANGGTHKYTRLLPSSAIPAEESARKEYLDDFYRSSLAKFLLAQRRKRRTPGVCTECGCTEKDCRDCIERTGDPCHWVNDERTLCSACQEGGEHV